MTNSVEQLWTRYRALHPDTPAALPLVYHFCDNEKDADICAALVASGRKRATATSLVELEMAGDPLPRTGDLAIITTYAGQAVALIRTTSVETRRFADVDEDFARREGEGDLTLDWWRDAHRAYYRRVLAGSAYVVDDDLGIACEGFEVVLLAGADGDAPIASVDGPR
ncbi:MAG: ASCH domain-containing protein [Pacificimonas sp.]